MRSLAQFSVRNPIAVLMLILAILLLGYISFQRLGVDLFPELANPRLFVVVQAGERPPEEMERQFAMPLEAVAARARGVENVAALVRTGRALLTVEYGWQVDMDAAFLDLQKGMADFAQRSDAEEITVSQQDPNAQAVVVAAFSHADIEDLDKLRRTAEHIIRSELIRLPGVAAVELAGARRRQVEIRTDAGRLAAYGLTLEQLAGTVQTANRNSTGGSLVEMGRSYIIRGLGEMESLDEIGALIVAYKPTGADPASRALASNRVPVYLRDVAEVVFALERAENIVRLDGSRCIGLEIYKEARFNTVDAVASIHQRLEVLRRSLPGYRIDIVQDQARFIEAAVAEVGETGLLGIGLAVLVLYIFLRRVGVTAVICMAIPISVVATFNLMYFNELTLNIMTLGGLALGAGMLLDNAIVVVENIFRHLEDGRDLGEAAVRGTAEVGGAITSATLTTIVVFLPIVYLHGAAGELFRDQAWTVAFSLLSSLFVALLVIPMLCSRLLRGGGSKVLSTVAFPRYARLLQKLLRRRGWVVLVALLLVLGAVVLVPRVGSEFMPRASADEVALQLTLAEGTSLERSEGAVRNIERFLQTNFAPYLEHLYVRVGPAGDGAGVDELLAAENSALVHISLRPEAGLDAAALVGPLTDQLAGILGAEARFPMQQTALEASLGRSGMPLEIEIKGEDMQTLVGLADQVAGRLRQIPALEGVEISVESGRPEVDVVIDRIAAAQHQLTVQAIGDQLQNLLSGRQAGQLRSGGDYADILLRHPRLSLDELAAVTLETSAGGRVRLDQVARLVSTVAPNAIERRNQGRVVYVGAQLAAGLSFDRVIAQVQTGLAGLELPPAYGLAIAGEERLRQEAFANLRFALLLALVLVYMVMAAQFESLLHPFAILLSVPLAGVGTVFLLLLTGIPFNVMSLIGVVVLVGIAVNDSIVLVDRINQGRRAGLALEAAVIDAGQTRIRPIIMTSLTTVLALLPLAVGFGQGAELRAPMAVAVIGGLFTSTALTLVVIPCLYHLLARFDRLRAEA
ncbi:MAG: MMPL family transporter [Candidatus Latescibacteria bacterium]|nr:MMPL family transporter [Candidatus Latescibacterota bacterium]